MTSNILYSNSESFNKIAKWVIPILLVLMFVVSLITTISSNYWIRKEISERQLSLAQSTSDNLSNRFKSQETIAVNLMTVIYPYLCMDNISGYQEYAEVSKLVNSKDLSLYQTKIYVPDYKSYSSQQDIFFPLSQMKLDPVLSNFYGKVGITWLEPAEVKRSSGVVHNMLGCVFTMNRIDNYSVTAGSIVLYYPVDKILEAFVEFSAKSEMYLVNREGKVLIGRDSGKVLLNDKETELLNLGTSGSKILNGQVFSFCMLNGVDWYVVIKSQTPVINLAAPFTIIPLLISIILIITFIIGISVFFNTRQMNKVLIESMEASFKQKLELSEYQMQALQEQIKPHFLYNTLDIIRWMIVDGNNKDAEETITALSKYLRMSISTKSGTVTIEEELNLAETYVNLVKIKSFTEFELISDIQDDTLSCRVPRSVLQPIIENSLIHGIFYCKKPNLELRIRTWIDDGKLYIEIEDNGNGMSLEKLASVFDESTSEPGHGYGLKNTKKRLKVFNGPNTVFEIHSKENIGTCVSIVISSDK